MIYLFSLFKSKYCLIVFPLSLGLSYLMMPGKVFYSWYILVSVLFMLSFSLVVTCIIRNVKEKILLAKTYKSSIVGIVATALGLASLQVCGVGAPVCSAAVGAGILSSLFPTVFLNLMEKYALQFILASILFQLIALYFMNCFKQVSSLALSKAK